MCNGGGNSCALCSRSRVFLCPLHGRSLTLQRVNTHFSHPSNVTFYVSTCIKSFTEFFHHFGLSVVSDAPTHLLLTTLQLNSCVCWPQSEQLSPFNHVLKSDGTDGVATFHFEVSRCTKSMWCAHTYWRGILGMSMVTFRPLYILTLYFINSEAATCGIFSSWHVTPCRCYGLIPLWVVVTRAEWQICCYPAQMSQWMVIMAEFHYIKLPGIMLA
jgi:hypothetical protein